MEAVYRDSYLPTLRLLDIVSVFFISPKSPSFDHRRKNICSGHHDPHLEAYRAFGFRAEASKLDVAFSI